MQVERFRAWGSGQQISRQSSEKSDPTWDQSMEAERHNSHQSLSRHKSSERRLLLAGLGEVYRYSLFLFLFLFLSLSLSLACLLACLLRGLGPRETLGPKAYPPPRSAHSPSEGPLFGAEKGVPPNAQSRTQPPKPRLRPSPLQTSVLWLFGSSALFHQGLHDGVTAALLPT